jgi:AcrR family transcriptional regulator
MARTRTTPRKKAVQARSQATVEIILAATARILVKDGYDRASTNRIALAAGVSVGSLYQYFPSKEALVAALIERHMNEMRAVVHDAFVRLADATVEDAAREMVNLMVRAHAIDPRLHKALVEQVPRIGRLEHVHAIEDDVLTITRAYLEARKEELGIKNTEVAAFIVVHAIEALTHRAVLMRPELLDEPAFIDDVTRLVVGYLRGAR